jgi:chromosome segregation ATPase
MKINSEISNEFYDSHAKRKKWTLTVFVLFLVGLIFLVFSVFGKLLNDYLDFEATKIEAAKHLEDMHSRFNEQEEQLSIRKDDYDAQINEKADRLQQLDDNITKRESKIASQQQLIAEYDTLAEIVSTLKSDYLILFKEWDILKQSNAKEEGVVSAIKIELNSLSSQKEQLQNDIIDLTKTKKEVTESSEILKNTIKSLELSKSKVQADLLELKQSLDGDSNRLSNLNIKIDNARKLLSQLEDDIRKEKAAYELVKSRITFANETVDAKTAEKNELDESILALKNNASKLSAEISLLEDQKLQAKAIYQNMENDISKAEVRLKATQQKIENSISPLLPPEDVTLGDDKLSPMEIQENNPAE